jgi:arylsulfatase A-like enzyme/HEAT repeat protein
MTEKILAWAVCGCVAGLAIGAADAIVLIAGARAMFFGAGELARAAVWSIGLCSGAGSVGLAAVGAAVEWFGSILERTRLIRLPGYVSLIASTLFLSPIFAVLWQLTKGPQASQVPRILYWVAAASLILSYISGFAVVFVPRWAAVGPQRRIIVAVAALAFGAITYMTDLFVLVRLYPVFHGALTFVGFLVGGVGLRIWLGSNAKRARLRFSKAVAVGSVLCGALSLVFIRGSQNPRFVIGERTAAASDLLALSMIVVPPSSQKSLDAVSDEVEMNEPAATTGPRVTRPGASLFLFTIDAMRYDRLSLLGTGRTPAPNVDKLALRSVVFSRAYTPIPHTSYAISSLLTGKYTHALVKIPGAPRTHETWPEILGRFRYKTAAFFTPAVFFIDKAQFEPYIRSSYGFSYRKVDCKASADERADQLVEYLRETRKEAYPVFAWVHFFEPHEPYDPKCTRFGDRPEDRYDCEIWNVDQAVGRIIDYLGDAYPEAIIIVAADHGEEFDDHGGRFHGTTLYDEQARVPLIIHVPGVEHRVVDEPVSLVDLLGTSLALLDVPIPARVRSRDLTGFMTGRAGKSDAYAEIGETVMVVAEGHKLICDNAFDICRLYDLTLDPGEKISVAGQKTEVLARMKTIVKSWMKSHARVELRPVETAAGSVEWPEAVQRGMTGDSEAIPALVEVVKTESRQDVRRKAAQILNYLWSDGSPEDIPSLDGETDPEVAAWLAVLKLKAGEPDAALRLAEVQKTLVKLSDAWRAAALTRLRASDQTSIGDVLEIAIQENTPIEERLQAIELLSYCGDRSLVLRLLPLIDNYQLTLKAAEALGRLKDRRAVKPLIARLKRERFKERKAAIMEALAQIGDVSALGAISDELFENDPPSGTLQALVRLAGSSKKDRLILSSNNKKRAEISIKRNINTIFSKMKKVQQVIVDSAARADGGTIVISCNNRESGRINLFAGRQESLSGIDSCSKGKGPIEIKLAFDPADLNARVDAIALIGE